MDTKTRDRLITFLLFLPLMIFFGCRVYLYATRYETVIVTQDAPGLAGVSIEFDADTYGKEYPTMTYTVVNDGENRISLKENHFETLRQDGAWEYQRRTRTGHEPGGIIEVEPGGRSAPFEVFVRNMKPGQYRIALDYYTAIDGDIAYYTTYAEFAVS